jgi:hypothetical protein
VIKQEPKEFKERLKTSKTKVKILKIGEEFSF